MNCGKAHFRTFEAFEGFHGFSCQAGLARRAGALAGARGGHRRPWGAGSAGHSRAFSRMVQHRSASFSIVQHEFSTPILWSKSAPGPVGQAPTAKGAQPAGEGAKKAGRAALSFLASFSFACPISAQRGDKFCKGNSAKIGACFDQDP